MENLDQRKSANLISKMLTQGSQKIDLCQFVLKLLIIHVFQRILCVLNSISIKSVGATAFTSAPTLTWAPWYWRFHKDCRINHVWSNYFIVVMYKSLSISSAKVSYCFTITSYFISSTKRNKTQSTPQKGIHFWCKNSDLINFILNTNLGFLHEPYRP